MRFTRAGSIMTVDLHGLYESDARNLLLNWLDHAPTSVTELRVIHGGNHGTVLKNLVRQELCHSKIKAKLPSLNPGETRLILKKK